MEGGASFARWDAEDIVLTSPVGPAFRIGPGGSVEDLSPSDSTDFKAALTEGQLFGHVLHRQQILALHGSASLSDGVAVGVLGFSGWGKSTMGASLRALGMEFVTDDVLALDATGRVLPGPSMARLWPDAARFVGLDPDEYGLVWPGHDKRRLPMRPPANPVPLGRLFVLDREASSVSATRLTPAAAFTELVRHSFAFLLLRERPEAWHFTACSRLAATVPTWRLGVPQGLNHVAEAAQLVVNLDAA